MADQAHEELIPCTIDVQNCTQYTDNVFDLSDYKEVSIFLKNEGKVYFSQVFLSLINPKEGICFIKTNSAGIYTNDSLTAEIAAGLNVNVWNKIFEGIDPEIAITTIYFIESKSQGIEREANKSLEFGKSISTIRLSHAMFGKTYRSPRLVVINKNPELESINISLFTLPLESDSKKRSLNLNLVPNKKLNVRKIASLFTETL